MINRFYLILSLFLIFTSIQAKEYKDEIKDFKIIKVRDGDTFVINTPNVPDVFGD